MTAAFNRRMRKTARTVVWEGAGAKSPALDPISGNYHFNSCRRRATSPAFARLLNALMRK